MGTQRETKIFFDKNMEARVVLINCEKSTRSDRCCEYFYKVTRKQLCIANFLEFSEEEI